MSPSAACFKRSKKNQATEPRGTNLSAVQVSLPWPSGADREIGRRRAQTRDLGARAPVARGSILANRTTLGEVDGAAVSGEEPLAFVGQAPAEVLAFDLGVTVCATAAGERDWILRGGGVLLVRLGRISGSFTVNRKHGLVFVR